ncbi:hypothetical protein SUGI_0626050 [Cryptomeria japonica]|nr:hypothetical protein SUGI_0626050 [Cryptomeria japonica]
MYSYDLFLAEFPSFSFQRYCGTEKDKMTEEKNIFSSKHSFGKYLQQEQVNHVPEALAERKIAWKALTINPKTGARSKNGSGFLPSKCCREFGEWKRN